MTTNVLRNDELLTQFDRFFGDARAALAAARPDVVGRAAAFLGDLRQELASARAEIRAHECQHADRFNIFDHIQPDENRLSDILADLLNPNGMHGQREAFLKLFLTRCGLTDHRLLESARVQRESATTYLVNDIRRLDVLIDLDTFGIGVENKPTAPDQENQVRDYLLNLHRQYGENFLLVYLSGSGQPPSEYSVDPAARAAHETAGQFQTWTYGNDLAEWLADAEAACEAERVRWFLRDFREYVQRRFR